MAAKTVLVCSNGVNRGCGSIAVSVEQLLRRAGYRVVHASSSTPHVPMSVLTAARSRCRWWFYNALIRWAGITGIRVQQVT